MGEGDAKRAAFYVGNAISMLVICGVVLCIVAHLFLTPMLRFFGSTQDILGYARTYTAITAFGFPFLILALSIRMTFTGVSSAWMTLLS